MFVIPIIIVGFKMYDRKQKEKAEARRLRDPDGLSDLADLADLAREPSSETCPALATQTSDVSSTDNEKSTIVSDTINVSRCTKVEKRPDWISGIGKLAHHHQEMFKEQEKRDPPRNRSKREALTYEMLGNHCSNALPFPKNPYQ